MPACDSGQDESSWGRTRSLRGTGLPAVFTGAGIGGAAPASLPLGYALRDRVLEFMYRNAALYAPDLVGEEELADLRRPERKLEQVLGRLWRVVGEEALDCLHCLQVQLSNEAHMLCALHLARGGMHVTVNLDRGIEQAYELISGRCELPSVLRDAYGSKLAQWRARVGRVGALRVVASRQQFEDWAADGRPAGLLKVHGSLAATGRTLVDVVVEDTEELGGLSAGRRAAVESLNCPSGLLITGYGGLDPDVYGPLLQAASGTDSEWATKCLDDDSPVRVDCQRRGIRVNVGDPQGLASYALRELLGEHELQWPEIEIDGSGWSERIDAWGESLMARHHGARFAHAWAWLLADVGDRDRAARLLHRVVEHDPYDAARVRLADVLYDRARENDRQEALRLYRGLVLARALDWPTRAHCLLRLGGIARGRAVRKGGWQAAPYLVGALVAPSVVLAGQRLRYRDVDPEMTAAALGTLGQTVLRASEQAALHWPRRLWPVLSGGLMWAAARCERCAELTSNGNRRALASSHRLLALALAALLRGRAPDLAWQAQLESLADSYRHAGDLAGAGNCTAALAVIRMATDRQDVAHQHLMEARELYAEGRFDRQPLPSGAALLERLELLFERLQVFDAR
jgi:hypothetical protein